MGSPFEQRDDWGIATIADIAKLVLKLAEHYSLGDGDRQHDLGLEETKALAKIFEEVSEYYMFEDVTIFSERQFDLINVFEALHDIFREFSEQIEDRLEDLQD